MRLPSTTEAAVRDALHEVTVRALVAEQCPDTEATVKALREVSWAVIRAAELIRTAERETRAAAVETHERKAA